MDFIETPSSEPVREEPREAPMAPAASVREFEPAPREPSPEAPRREPPIAAPTAEVPVFEPPATPPPAEPQPVARPVVTAPANTPAPLAIELPPESGLVLVQTRAATSVAAEEPPAPVAAKPRRQRPPRDEAPSAPLVMVEPRKD